MRITHWRPYKRRLPIRRRSVRFVNARRSVRWLSSWIDEAPPWAKALLALYLFAMGGLQILAWFLKLIIALLS